MGNLVHSCLVDCVEQALQGESGLSSEGTRVKTLEHGRLDVVADRMGVLTVLVSGGVVQAIGCTVRVPGWDMVCEGKQVFRQGSFRDDS